jgi:hypothetical protein
MLHPRKLDFLLIMPVVISRMPIMAIRNAKSTARDLIVPTICNIAIIPKIIRKAPLMAGSQGLS